jgi:hypothetical protein
MTDLLTQFWKDLVGRIDGPLAFRLILQPIAAILLAIRAGLRDARTGRPAYGWIVITDPVRRRDLVREGCKEIAKVFVVAIAIDLIYEIVVFRAIHPVQSLIVAATVALVPYALFRGPVNRIVRRWGQRPSWAHSNRGAKT